MKFKNIEEKKGIILGSICFLPAFFLSVMLCKINILLGAAILIITQGMWLHSIELACKSLKKENMRLKTENEQLKKKLL